MSSFGSRIEQLRKGKELSQEALAQLMGKSHRAVISSWEKGKSEPSLSDIRKLAEILNTTVPYLTDGILTTTVAEPPPGYVMLPAQEVIDMQRQLLKQKVEENERLVNPSPISDKP